MVERVLVLGSGPLARTILEEFNTRPQFRHLVIGVVADGGNDVLPRRCLRLGTLEHLRHIIEDFGPDRIIVALGERHAQLPVHELLEPWAHGILVEDAVEVYEHLTGKLAIEAITPSIVFSKHFRKRTVDLAARRVVSLALAALGLLLTAPLFLLIGVLIKLDSRGPVFFLQERVGAGGRPFRLIKFRTMVPASNATSEWVRDNSGRITNVGRWLRKFRLDELPQFINVLRGEMDLVGPRPHPVSNHHLLVLVTRNVPDCGAQIPYYTLRSMIRPGITGWAQVRYGYANDFEEETEKIRYDLYYVKHMSVWLDIRILLDTIKIVLFGRGSERVVPRGEVRPTLGFHRAGDGFDHRGAAVKRPHRSHEGRAVGAL